MIAILIGTIWLLVGGFFGYWIGFASREEEMRRLARKNYYLNRWLENQVRATRDADLELELERIRNDV